MLAIAGHKSLQTGEKVSHVLPGRKHTLDWMEKRKTRCLEWRGRSGGAEAAFGSVSMDSITRTRTADFKHSLKR